MEDRSLLPSHDPIALIDAATETQHPQLTVCATRDHELIRRWATRHQAEPATGEATESGPSTVSINDEGAGIRFNFPAVERFRPVDWTEWFQNFEKHTLVFVYERDTPAALSYRYRLLPFERLSEIAHVRA